MSMEHESRIRERAQALWEQEGRPEGRHDEHWRRASQEIDEEVPRQHGGAAGEQPRSVLDEDEPVGETLEEIAKGEHQGP
jgi:hypothetical protein